MPTALSTHSRLILDLTTLGKQYPGCQNGLDPEGTTPLDEPTSTTNAPSITQA